jgi:hypothetical protein
VALFVFYSAFTAHWALAVQYRRSDAVCFPGWSAVTHYMERGRARSLATFAHTELAQCRNEHYRVSAIFCLDQVPLRTASERGRENSFYTFSGFAVHKAFADGIRAQQVTALPFPLVCIEPERNSGWKEEPHKGKKKGHLSERMIFLEFWFALEREKDGSQALDSRQHFAY